MQPGVFIFIARLPGFTGRAGFLPALRATGNIAEAGTADSADIMDHGGGSGHDPVPGELACGTEQGRLFARPLAARFANSCNPSAFLGLYDLKEQRYA